MDYLKKVIHDYHERKARADSQALPTPSCVRERSNTEREAEWHPAQWGTLFCPHGKSYFDTCGACHRDRKRARMEYDAFVKRHAANV